MKVIDFDAWLATHEKALYRASMEMKAARGASSVLCKHCRHSFRTYASPPCSECDVIGSKFEALGGDR